MAIGSLQTAPRFKLHRHRLEQVLCQVRFSPVLSLREDDAAIPFQEKVRRSYPRYSRDDELGMIVGPQGVQAQHEGPRLHRFRSPDGFTLTLGPEFLALETRAYERFDDFADRLMEALGHVGEIYEPLEIDRIGLRFVNELRLPSESPHVEMRRAITPVLLGLAASDELGDSVARSEQVIELRDDHGSNMLIRHGLFPGGTTVRSPAGPPEGPALNQPFYLIDTDSYRSETVAFDAAATREHVIEFNDRARTFFAWAVDEDYRRGILGQEDVA